ncbi:MAG: aminotransferase class V-fold PLP-dependent enzyme [Desulfatiglandales bacterium]
MEALRQEDIRKEFLALERSIYLNTAATGLLPLSTSEALNNLIRERSLKGPHYKEERDIIESTRVTVSKFLNCKASEVAFVPNTSSGISKIAQGIRLNPKEKLAYLFPDFPSNVYPWMWGAKRGLDVYPIRFDPKNFSLEDLKSQIRPSTRLVALSHVHYVSGFRFPLAEITRVLKREGVLVFVDMIQSLGAMPIDVKELGIDFMAAGSHKWLMGLPGAGILYISEEVLPMVAPTELGWKSVKHEELFGKIDLDLKEDASSLEPGTLNTLGILSIKKGIELLEAYGMAKAWKEIYRWNRVMREELEAMGYEVVSPSEEQFASGILSFRSGNPEGLYSTLLGAGIIVSLRNGLIRLSPHFYNDETDMVRTLKILKEA